MKKRRRLIGLAILLGIGILAFCISIWFLEKESLTPISKEYVQEVELYLPVDYNSLHVKRIVLKSPKETDKLALLLIEKLKEEKVVPSGTEILHFALDDDGVIYLDLSPHLLEGVDESSELVVVYSIVNTFIANIKNARKVQLLVDGEPLYTISGLIYTLWPLEYTREVTGD